MISKGLKGRIETKFRDVPVFFMRSNITTENSRENVLINDIYWRA